MGPLLIFLESAVNRPQNISNPNNAVENHQNGLFFGATWWHLFQNALLSHSGDYRRLCQLNFGDFYGSRGFWTVWTGWDHCVARHSGEIAILGDRNWPKLRFSKNTYFSYFDIPWLLRPSLKALSSLGNANDAFLLFFWSWRIDCRYFRNFRLENCHFKIGHIYKDG